MTTGAGEVLRRVHWQCWREDAPPLELSLGELAGIMPVLIRSGSVGLVWPQLRHGDYGAVGAVLEEAYQSQVAHNALVERDIARLASRLHGAGLHPVLIKGLAVSRLYPAGVVRSAGDIDLVVRDGDYASAREVLSDVRLSFHGDPAAKREHGATLRAAAAGGSAVDAAAGHAVGHAVEVDLHRFSLWEGSRDDRFFRDAELVPIGEGEVRVPRVEDRLEALCLHFLRHGAVRPMRLCDIALMIESHADDLDWDCLQRRKAIKTIMIIVQLAHDLLGADLAGAPPMVREHRLPGWLAPAVLRRWEGDWPPPQRPMMQVIRDDPRTIVPALGRRWPDPISATYRTGAPFNEFPRLPIQLAAYGRQLGRSAIRVLREQGAFRRGLRGGR